MKWKFILLVMLFILLSACSPVGDATEVEGETTDIATLPEPPPTQTEPAPSTITPLPPTEAATPTKIQPTPTEDPTQTEQQDTQVIPFTAESIGPGQQEAFSFLSSSGEEIIFWLYLPEEYGDSQTWPLIISMHGFLGFEPSIENVRGQSPPVWVDPEVEFPFIVISPMAQGSWAQYHEPLNELVDFLGESLLIDPELQFLTGLSTGATGTWQWALATPRRFIGVAPVVGSFSLNPNDPIPENICDLKDLPVWVAFSESDPLETLERSRDAIAALEDCGSTVARLTVYSDLDHMDSVRKVYAGPELYDWMLALVE
jgi:predicted peptidase